MMGYNNKAARVMLLADVTFCGETKSLLQWSQTTGISRDNLYQRIFIYKWPVERALTTHV
jgi:hypothetical protein